MSRYSRPDHAPLNKLLACRSGSRRPIVLHDSGLDRIAAERFVLIGRRLGFAFHVEGFSNGSEADVGWFDIRSGKSRFGLINAGENARPGDPLLPEDHIGLAIAPNGSVAFISGSTCQVVALLPARAHGDRFGHLLGPPHVLFRAPSGGLNPASIALGPGIVSWRNNSGMAGSAALTTTTPAADAGGCPP